MRSMFPFCDIQLQKRCQEGHPVYDRRYAVPCRSADGVFLGPELVAR